MARSRKSMVDSVYTIWKTCPSREHSSSAATCRAEQSWTFPGSLPGTSGARQTLGPRALGLPPPSRAPRGPVHVQKSRRLSGLKAVGASATSPHLPTALDPQLPALCCPKLRRAHGFTRMWVPSGAALPPDMGRYLEGLAVGTGQGHSPMRRAAWLEGGQSRGGTLIRGSRRAGVPPTVLQT